MPFDLAKKLTPATQSQVADIAIDTAVGLYAVASALDAIASKTGVDISKHLDDIHEMAESLNNRFDELTGYVAEDEDGG